jgi:hypothetical protein
MHRLPGGHFFVLPALERYVAAGVEVKSHAAFSSDRKLPETCHLGL